MYESSIKGIFDYTHDLWEYVEKDKTKIAKKVYNYLDKDSLMVYGSKCTWYKELVTRYTTYPKYVHEYLKKFFKKQYNMTYLYDRESLTF